MDEIKQDMALFIDADNAPAGKFGINEACRYLPSARLPIAGAFRHRQEPDPANEARV